MKHPDLRKKLAQVEGLTEEERAYLQSLLSTTKKYGLVWEDKPEKEEERLKTELPVLEEVVERRVLSPVQEKTAAAKESNQLTLDLAAPAPNVAVADDNTTSPLSAGAQSDGGEGGRGGEADKQAPNHLLIEGDNLHALTALSFTHAGKVDVIYIDPPYNTGKENEFKYNDKFVDKEDAFRHSKWLSFMHKRLKIAKTLLKEVGVIFISIDHNELAQLKLLCDEIFGEWNFIEYFSWTKTSTPPNLSKKSRKINEYIICYEKNKNNTKYKSELSDGGDAPLLNSGNNVSTLEFPRNSIHFKISDGVYSAGKYGKIEVLNEFKVLNSKNIENVKIKAEFKWSQEFFNEEVSKGTFFIVKSNEFSIRFQRLTNDFYKSPTNQILDKIINSNINKTLNNVDTNEKASSEVFEIIEVDFDYPKPVSLISYLLKFIPKSDVILDFFAGSGTTLHATMALNAEDGGNRQCILVTNNENNIAEEVCYERNKRVIEGYTKPNGEFVPGLSGNNLRYYRVGFVGSERTDANRRGLVRNATSMLQVMENCYTDLTESAGFDPALCHIATNDRGRYLVVVYHSRHQRTLTAPLSAWIAALPPETEPVRLYVFGHDPDVIRADFEEVADRIMPVPLPEAIYNAYRNTFRSLDLYRKPAATREDETSPENED